MTIINGSLSDIESKRRPRNMLPNQRQQLIAYL